ncbi:hypothetical protein F4861DRAFT_542998 [Xylaria intraflava]|nr:hypothetical protein F4861DRAFT_542998 [Xylaria intraflava]
MWYLSRVTSISDVWFSDGKPVFDPRGGDGASYRLIVDKYGFLDLTEIPTPPSLFLLDANGVVLSGDYPGHGGIPLQPTGLSLQVGDDGNFTLQIIEAGGILPPTPIISGKLKPLPNITAAEAAFIDEMIKKKYIPYQNIPDAPGKTVEEIKALGRQFFPFSPHSFELAMSVYDWTTASFARLVFLKVFEYTSIPQQPFPLDENSIAGQIWNSSWKTYKPQNADYMNSFMMQPAYSLENVKEQLSRVGSELHKLSTIENKVQSAAALSMPRTSTFLHPQLFSGQVDIYQMGLDRFGIEFLECPLNSGPVGEELIIPFASVLSTYVSSGRTITTKMTWSFTDSVKDALHYSNGILLVANCPRGSAVWDTASYVTPLSDDPKKWEYLFAPGSQFEVQSVDTAVLDGKSVVVITLDPLTPPPAHATAQPELSAKVAEAIPNGLETSHVLDLVAAGHSDELPHTEHATSGRHCACCV